MESASGRPLVHGRVSDGREIGPVTAIVLAGVAGTAITADFGTRKIRHELDALRVLGIDPIKNLIVPRSLPPMLVAAMLNVCAILFGIISGLLAEIVDRMTASGQAESSGRAVNKAVVVDFFGVIK
ncbi:MAG: ABC transporter permease [Solirubrobacteraceae bacterium]